MGVLAFGRELRVAREAAGLSRRQVAEMSGCSPAAVEQWESGRREPSASALAGLCRAIGVDCAVLNAALLKDDPPPPVRKPGRPKKTPDPPEPSPESPDSGDG